MLSSSRIQVSVLFFGGRRIQAHRVQNQETTEKLKGSSALKRKVEVDSPNVALQDTPGEESKERQTKRPKTAGGGIDSAEAPEGGRPSIFKYGLEYNVFIQFF